MSMFNYYIYLDNACYSIKSYKELKKEELSLIYSLICGGQTISNDIITKTTRKYIDNMVEIGPRLHFRSPWCSNALSVLNKCGLNTIERIEISRIVVEDNIKYDRMTECIYKHKNNIYDSNNFDSNNYSKSDIVYLNMNNIRKYNQRYGYGFDKIDMEYYTKVFEKYNRHPTNVELFDLAQSNSEHSRHWTFNGEITFLKYDNPNPTNKTLFQMIKSTLDTDKRDNSILAFCDNSSAIRGFRTNVLSTKFNEANGTCSYIIKDKYLHPVLTAETHNFPTGMAPFPGAATGIGGRIRDNLAVGKGGITIASSAGYSVGNLFLDLYDLPWEKKKNFISSFKNASDILIEASNGASDYGNKYGEPIIIGFTRSFGLDISYKYNNSKLVNRFEYIKPIMFTGGIGQLQDEHINKAELESGYLIVRVGGPAYRIGMGGGTASSRNQSCRNTELDLNAVQRGDPEMENRVYKFIRSCIELDNNNPILSIHDQGAGGMANVTKEIVYPNGGLVSLSNVIIGDKSLSTMEIWSSEHQEQVSIIIHPRDIKLVKKIAKRENVPISFFGFVTNTGEIEVYDKNNPTTMFPVSLHLEDISGKSINKPYFVTNNTYTLNKLIIPYCTNLLNCISNIFHLVTVGSKRFLTNKVDRSVTGLIAQQQCVGYLHTPLSNLGVIAQSHFGLTGIATSIGEQPIKGLIDQRCMARMTVAEMLTNLMWVEITSFDDIVCSGNWMWPLKNNKEERTFLYQAVDELCQCLKTLGISIDGGKDSLSMSVKYRNDTIKSPGTLVLSSYVTCPNILNIVTPDFKQFGSSILFIDLSCGKRRLGGSALAQTLKQLGDCSPNLEDIDMLKNVFNNVHNLIKNKQLLAGHDISDGGLITTLLEMCFAGNMGCNINIRAPYSLIEYMFAEEIGILLEVPKQYEEIVTDSFNEIAPCYTIGETTYKQKCVIHFNNNLVLDEYINNLRNIWEETSFKLELLQCENSCVKAEQIGLSFRKQPKIYIPTKIVEYCKNFNPTSIKPKVAILRDEGSNGEREMASAFYMAGFDVYDITMNDLLGTKEDILSQFSGIAFVGGFTYSDVFGAGVGWYHIIKHNKHILKQFDDFYKREDTFSFGVCNGCQLMALLKWVPGNCRFVKNKSNRFESRFSNVRIRKSNAIMLKNMEESILGVWVAHSEGRFEYDIDECNICQITPIQFVDDNGKSTELYPFNPNGSIDGITSICSYNGRHLAMMPHPERCFLTWQMPWIPNDFPLKKSDKSPWMALFYNAYEWCIENM